jgi:hypothetical protein
MRNIEYMQIDRRIRGLSSAFSGDAVNRGSLGKAGDPQKWRKRVGDRTRVSILKAVLEPVALTRVQTKISEEDIHHLARISHTHKSLLA